jgi:hypothetical protein
MRSVLVISFAALALVALNGSLALADTVRIWKVGSPHRGDTPAPTIPASLKEAAEKLGVSLSIETFPAEGFAATVQPATLVAPGEGSFPTPAPGERFGTFDWTSSPSGDVVTQIVEFAYEDDARLFFEPTSIPGARHEISSGRLWSTRSMWGWRVWSINQSGDVTLSTARRFTH